MEDVDAAVLDLVRFFFLVLEAALVPVVLVGLFFDQVNSLVFCFFRVFFWLLFGGVVLIALLASGFLGV